ncbi:MAG: F0F1 ATP synthase subunit B, partial [Sciscionella sp.]
ALTEARNESAKIRDDARAKGQQIIDEMREQTNSEVARIRQDGEEQLASQREAAAEQLRAHIGELSSALAGRVIGEDLSSSSRSETVYEFLRDLAERSSGGA